MQTSKRMMVWFGSSVLMGQLACATAPDGDGEELAMEAAELVQLPPGIVEAASHGAYLKSRLAALRASGQMGIVPALAASLVRDGEIAAVAVDGVRTFGQPDPVASGDYFNMGSVGKVATGYLVAQMIAWNTPIGGGKTLSWTTKLFDVFPELAATSQPAYLNVTIQQLLSHTSGMPAVPLREPPDQYASLYPGDMIARRYAYVHDAILDVPVVQPGMFNYGGGSIIVAAMLERLTGSTWEDMFASIVEPQLGMTNTGPGQAPFPASTAFTSRHTRDQFGIPVAWDPPPGADFQANSPAGNLHASVSDMSKLASAFMVNSSHRAGSVPLATILDGITQVPNGYTKLGWGTGGSPWDGSPILWKNGSDGRSHALIYVSNQDNFATVSAASIDIGDDNANIVHGEIAALQRHFSTSGGFTRTKTIGATASATSSATGAPASQAVDGSLASSWRTGATSATLTLQLPTAQAISELRIAEEGSHVQSFTVSALLHTVWGPIWITLASGTTLGANFATTFSSTTTDRIQLTLTGTTGMGIDELWAF